jgi:hypothetical protein
VYKILSGMSAEILEAQAKGTIEAVSLNKNSPLQKINLGGYVLEAGIRSPQRNSKAIPGIGYVLIINSAPDEYTIAGYNAEISFKPSTPGPQTAGFAAVWEGTYVNGQWKAGRKLNGDNIMRSYNLSDEAAKNQTGTVARFDGAGPEIFKVKLYRFE